MSGDTGKLVLGGIALAGLGVATGGFGLMAAPEIAAAAGGVEGAAGAAAAGGAAGAAGGGAAAGGAAAGGAAGGAAAGGAAGMATAAPGVAGAFGPTAGQAGLTGLLADSAPATPMFTEMASGAAGMPGVGAAPGMGGVPGGAAGMFEPSSGQMMTGMQPQQQGLLGMSPTTYGDRFGAMMNSPGMKYGQRGMQVANAMQPQQQPNQMQVVPPRPVQQQQQTMPPGYPDPRDRRKPFIGSASYF